MSQVENNSEDNGLLSAINITPFVDVVLVLLVIFMVTTPILMKENLDIHLPQTKSGDAPELNTISIAINAQGQILMNGELVNEISMSESIHKNLKDHPDTQAIISADIKLDYGRVVQIIDQIKTAGLEKFALQIEKQEEIQKNK